jgi:hypothetical protein
MIRYSRVFALSALVVLVGACSAPGTPPAAATPTQPAQELPLASVPGETRYINEEGRFSLVLPEGWSAAGPFVIPIDGGASYNLYALGMEPSAEGGPGTSRIIVADSASLTPEQFVTLQCSICPEHPVEEVTLGATSARATRIGGGSVPFEVEWFFFEHSGKRIWLSILSPETMETLEAVVQSLQLE